MTENLDELETQFNYQEYILHEKIEGYIFNFHHIIKDDDTAYGKIYFVTKDLKNFFIKVPYFYSLLIECRNIGDVEEFIKNQYTEGYHSSEIVEKYDCLEYNHLNKSKKKYLKINFKYQSIFNKLIRDIRRILVRNKNDKNIEDVYKDMMDKNTEFETTNIKSCIENIHEYDIPHEISIANTYKIRAGSWYEFSYNREEYTINTSKLIVMPEFRILAFDIETMKKPLKFPDSKFDQVMMISIKTESSNILITNRTVVSQNIGTFEYSPKEDMASMFTTYNMDCEEDLLLKFAEIIQIHKPHIVTTFNGYFFDFPYVEARMLKYGLIMRDLIGFSCVGDYYSCPFILHLDCFKWVVRDSYLPMGSQGLKAVTKAKLGYLPDEIDPEEMVETAQENPLKMAAYSVSDAVATYFLFVKYVQPHIFSLSSILPYPPVKVLCRGSGSLCEALLIIEAYNYSLLIPKEKRKDFLEIHDGKVIDNMTYVGGYVEALKPGIFRSDFEHTFTINKEGIQDIIESIDEVFKDFENESDIDLVKLELKSKLLQFESITKCTGNIYHLDVSAMYPNIILTNRLQPTSIVTNDICVRCDYSTKNFDCKRNLNWEAKIDYFVPNVSEIKQIQQNAILEYNNKHERFLNKSTNLLSSNLKRIKTDAEDYDVKFEELTQNKQDIIIRKKILEYSRNIYKKSKNSVVEKRDATVCQREIPFYVDSVRKFRDQRYVYKKKLKDSTILFEKTTDLNEKREYQKEMIVYSSLQIAHKCILNSFYGYVMGKGARWHSTEMAAIVCNIGAQIIKNCKAVVEGFAVPLELDTDGIWALIPSIFPFEITFKSGKKFNFLNSFINFKVCSKFTNMQYQDKIDGKYVLKPNNSIEFEIDGPYKGMVIPSALEEGKQLKKRYIVLNYDNSIAEFKGFELKRRGELEIVKRLQEELFECFGNGQTLVECYDELAQICKYWLDLIDNKGKSLDDDDIFELFSECKSMSKDISEYDSKASSLLSTARKMAEILGDDILSEKLKVEYIVSEFPKDEVVSNRTIPTVVFKSVNKDVFLRKWCKISKVLDVREIIDWNYYKKRVEDIVVKIIILPAIHQNIQNPLPNVKMPDWTSKLTTKYDLLDYFTVRKVTKEAIIRTPTVLPDVVKDPRLEYYTKLKNQSGVLKLEENDGKLIKKMFNKTQINVYDPKIIYFKADRLFHTDHKVNFVKKYLPYGQTLEDVAFVEINNPKVYPEVLKNPLITEIYHDNIPSIFEKDLSSEKVSKNPEFVILTTFNFNKSIIYVFSKNDKFYCVSILEHDQIVFNDIKEFLNKHVNNLIILNLKDRYIKSLQKLCSAYCHVADSVQIDKQNGTFGELLLNQKDIHKKITKNMIEKIKICGYLSIPVGNSDINILDYCYFRMTAESNGLVTKGDVESSRLFKTEKINAGYYEMYTVQFECVGSLILSIIEYKSILDQATFQDLYRNDFKVLYNLVKKIFIDHSKNVPGASIVLNKLEKWIRWESNLLSKELRDLVILLHQRFIFNIVAKLKELKIPIVYLNSNLLWVDTEKNTKEGADEIFEYFRKTISEIPGYSHLVCRKLRVFEKLLFNDPNNYFYKKDSGFFCVSDKKLPNEYIEKYFSSEKINSVYIYELVTKTNEETAKTIIKTLLHKPDMVDVISNCKKLLKIDEYSKEVKDIEVLIICEKCNMENVLRSRCIRCMNKYSTEDVYKVVLKYFTFYLNLELSDEAFCNKCSGMNERRLTENCSCGGVYIKKSYAREFKCLLDKLSTESIVKEFKAKLKYYKINYD